MAYETGETRVWTARDEREQRAEYKRATRATRKHLQEIKAQVTAHLAEHGEFQSQQQKPQSPPHLDRTFMDKLLRRNTAPNPLTLPPEKRPLPPKSPKPHELNLHWWGRVSVDSGLNLRRKSQDSRAYGQPVTPTPTVNARVPPPIPPRYDLMDLKQPTPGRPRSKSAHDAAERRHARETTLHHLQTDRDCRRFMKVDKPDVSPIRYKPGTWIPGQLNPVNYVYPDGQHVDVHGFNMPKVKDRCLKPTKVLPPRKPPPTGPPPPPPFSLPVIRPLDVAAARRRKLEGKAIPLPPIPVGHFKSNYDPLLELGKKRSSRL